MLLPGLLGSLFVFAGILGCKTGRGGHHLDPGRQPAVHGAAGGRLPRRPGGAARNLPALFGALLLVAGAYLVAKRSF